MARVTSGNLANGPATWNWRNVVRTLLHHLVESVAEREPDAVALVYRQESLTYAALWQRVSATARGFVACGIAPGDRIAVFLEKRFESVISILAASLAGAVFVPVNPQLKPRQVTYILGHCDVRLLVTSDIRLRGLQADGRLPDSLAVILAVDHDGGDSAIAWESLDCIGADVALPTGRIDGDLAAILYTSGSTGPPKGVMLSHRNLVFGAKSVSRYLDNRPSDRILAVLPLSFDAGLSQLTTAFCAGACAILMNYVMARGVPKLCAEERITCLTLVAPLWVQMAKESWPAEAVANMRYFANTGGHMPVPTLADLRRHMPDAKPYLMYGLTEAFRSTYLDPAEVDRRPDSIGKAIPNEEVLVVDEDGRLCGPGDEGELVHRGALVALGYWNDPSGTAKRFRPAPGKPREVVQPQTAVWSGDTVRLDDEGFLYFVGRKDDMIKALGYRVSPTEIEDVVRDSGLVAEVAAVGVPHPVLGQAVAVVCTSLPDRPLLAEAVIGACRKRLPNYMVPVRVEERNVLPLNVNGKIDRRRLAAEMAAPDGELVR